MDLQAMAAGATTSPSLELSSSAAATSYSDDSAHTIVAGVYAEKRAAAAGSKQHSGEAKELALWFQLPSSSYLQTCYDRED